MAIAPGSYSFMGGAVLGKGSEGQFVLVRSGSLLTTFTDDEYNACLEAVNDGKAVCVQYKIGPATFQTQLLNVTGLGDLQFVDTSVQSITHYRVTGTSPHTVSIVKTGSAQQFVLERDDMRTAFTASEYLQCQTRISEGTALCVQWKSGSARMQAQLATILADGSLLFSHTTVDLETIFIVAGSDPHNITAHTNSLGGGDQFVLVRSDMTSMFTNTEYQDCVDAVAAGKAVCVQYGSNQIQLGGIAGGALIFTQSAPDVITKYTVSPTTDSHTISAERIAVGVPIYASLQSAIADEAKLPIGTYFETNGFYASGDGGAARYKVSSTGTSNGMDIVQLAAGKLAVLQTGDWVVPEQLGYVQSYSRDDVVPYIERAIAMGCQHIHLRSSGNGAGYTWKSKLTVTSRGFKLKGEGDWGYPNKFTYIVFRPTDASINAMINMKARDVLLKDLDIEVTGDYVKAVDCITNTGYDSDENRFWEIDNVRFNSFDNCIKFSGGIKWQNAIRNCLFNSCKIGLQIYESSTFELMVDNCLFTNCEQYDVLVNGGLFAAVFKSCGFGSQSTAVGLTTPSDQYLYQNIKFEGCNFEIDTSALINAPAVFIDCFPDPSHPYIRQNVTIANCHFTPIKVSYTDQGTTNRYIRLAPKTNILLISNQILGKDEPQHPDWVLYPKLIWNENYLPTLGFGGIVECGNNLCGNGNFDYPDALLPFVTRNTQARSLLAIGAQSGSETAIGDCDAFIPKYCGELIVARASTFESTAHMPTGSMFGFLYSMGVTEGPSKRVVQMLIASNSNLYTRVGRDTGGGWQFDPWKTITAT